MAVSDLDVQARFPGTGSQTDFAINFTFLDNDDIRVVLRDETIADAPFETLQVLGVDYNFDDPNAPTQVEFVTPPTTEDVVLLIRQSVKDQPINYVETAPFPSETAEEGFDHSTLLTQEVCNKLDRRALLYDESTPTSGISVAEPVADEFLQYNATADRIVSKTAAEIAAISADIDTLLGLTVGMTIGNNEATPQTLVGWTLDAAVKSSGCYWVEIIRKTTGSVLFASGTVYLQRAGLVPTWRVITSVFEGDVALAQGGGTTAAGVIFSVIELGGVAQVQGTTGNLTGSNYSDEIKIQNISFPI